MTIGEEMVDLKQPTEEVVDFFKAPVHFSYYFVRFQCNIYFMLGLRFDVKEHEMKAVKAPANLIAKSVVGTCV